MGFKRRSEEGTERMGCGFKQDALFFALRRFLRRSYMDYDFCDENFPSHRSGSTRASECFKA
jgi:hypothetical protein